MTTTIRIGRGITRTTALVLRAVLCAVLAAVATFSPRPPEVSFGLVVLGVFLVVQAGVLALGVRAVAASVLGRRLVAARAVVSLAAGAVALLSARGDFQRLLWIETLVFLVLGVLELVGGVRRTEAAETTGDAIVVGGLQVLVGLMLVILDPDVLFAVGVLGAWGAVVAVYLGIAAASLVRRDRSA